MCLFDWLVLMMRLSKYYFEIIGNYGSNFRFISDSTAYRMIEHVLLILRCFTKLIQFLAQTKRHSFISSNKNYIIGRTRAGKKSVTDSSHSMQTFRSMSRYSINCLCELTELCSKFIAHVYFYYQQPMVS